MKSTIPRRLATLLVPLTLMGALIGISTSAIVAQPAQASVATGDVFFNHAFGSSQYLSQRASDGTVTDMVSLGQWPDVSPDGSKVAFVQGGATNGAPVEVMNSDGSAITQIDFPHTTAGWDTVSDRAPRWSPDGKWIVFAKQESTYFDGEQIWKVKADGSDLTQLTSSSTVSDYGPSWSPTKDSNGDYRIVFASDQNSPGNGHYWLYIMDADGTNVHAVGSGQGDISPVWSPDGSRIYDADWSGTMVYYTSSDGFTGTSASGNVFHGGDIDGSAPQLSADGSTMYYTNTDLNEVFSVTGTDSPIRLTDDTVVTGNGTDPSPVLANWSIKKFTVLGDSYSSGEGNPPFIAGTDTTTDKCHRSDAAYAFVLANHPNGLQLGDYGLSNFACSGATTGDMTTTFNTESSQMNAVDGSDAYIILTIGGNDVQFSEFAHDCVQNNCDGSSQYYTTEGRVQNILPGNLDTLFGDIATQLGSSSTRVLVLGYPYIMPDSGSLCSFLTSGEQTAATNIQTDLNGAIHSAVTRAGSPFEYVDPNATGSPFDGHQLCSSQPYFNGLIAPPDDDYSFHPNADGHTAYAKVVTDYLVAHP